MVNLPQALEKDKKEHNPTTDKKLADKTLGNNPRLKAVFEQFKQI